MGSSSSTPQIVIRRARSADVPELVELARLFCEETALPAPFNERWSTLTFNAHMGIEPNRAMWVSLCQGEIVGGIMAALDYDFTSLPYCYITKIYTKPPATPFTAVQLLEEVERWAAERHACALMATATAGISERLTRAMIALFKRKGFSELGPVMAKEMTP